MANFNAIPHAVQCVTQSCVLHCLQSRDHYQCCSFHAGVIRLCNHNSPLTMQSCIPTCDVQVQAGRLTYLQSAQKWRRRAGSARTPEDGDLLHSSVFILLESDEGEDEQGWPGPDSQAVRAGVCPVPTSFAHVCIQA